MNKIRVEQKLFVFGGVEVRVRLWQRPPRTRAVCLWGGGVCSECVI